MKNILLLPKAISEIENLVEYYHQQEEGLEFAFLDEIEFAIKRIQEAPLRYP